MNISYQYEYVPYRATGSFSKLATDYADLKAELEPFVSYAPNKEGLLAAITARKAYPVNRAVLTKALERQYNGLEMTDAVRHNVALLGKESTYTVTTAHQPNLMTGYLYFVYKILHAIKLANVLKAERPELDFVPVYYMGSEDNDLDELGVFRYRGEQYRWDGNGQKGAVGRMDTATLKSLVNELMRKMGPPGADCEQLKNMILTAYTGHKTVGAATKYLVNSLFGKYGLVVLDPDDAEMKREFVPVMEQELLEQRAQPIIAAQTELLEEHYKSQIYVRPINLFYLHEQMRERIELHGDRWVVLNSDISFGKDELLTELHEYPERFSPNVALRGLFQATILPDVAFVGGGAEVAYWLQLKTLFAHYNRFYPVILLRQSVLLASGPSVGLRAQAGVTAKQLFERPEDVLKEQLIANGHTEWQLGGERAELARLMQQLHERATKVDKTLDGAAKAALHKMQQQIDRLEHKMLKAEKLKHSVLLERLNRLRKELFPGGGLQERRDSFVEYYLDWGSELLDAIYAGIEPMQQQLMILTKRI